MMVYLDSNVFIFAAISNEPRAKKAQEILKKVILGESAGITSSLTVDEVLWKIWKVSADRNLAIEEGLRLLQFDNLKIIEIGRAAMADALILMSKYKSLKPRDAIHLSVAIKAGTDTIISDDSDFDRIEEIKRKSLD